MPSNWLLSQLTYGSCNRNNCYVQEASTSLRAVPATYRTVTETIVVQPARTDIQVIPAVYETRTERVLISPAREEWKPGAQAINYNNLQRGWTQ